MSLLERVKNLFTAEAPGSVRTSPRSSATSPEGVTKTYLTVQDLEGRPVQILAADEQRHYQDQAKEAARRLRVQEEEAARQRAIEDEEQARKAALNMATGTQRRDA